MHCYAPDHVLTVYVRVVCPTMWLLRHLALIHRLPCVSSRASVRTPFPVPPSFTHVLNVRYVRTYSSTVLVLSTVLFLFHLEVPLLYERSSAVRSPSIFPSSFSSFVLSSFVSFFSFVSASSSSCTHLPLFVRLRTPSPCPHPHSTLFDRFVVRTYALHALRSVLSQTNGPCGIARHP